MNEIDLPLIIGIIVSLALSAFFSGMEIAFVSSSRLQAEVDKEKMGVSRLPLKVF
jgi:CBS domain containing-hemolysin-like protein